MSRDKTEETVAVGYRRGEYQWRVGDVAKLKEREGRESKTFFAGGKKWALALLLWPHNCGLFNVVKVLLISRNGEGVGADVEMTVTNTMKPHKEFKSGRKWKVATAYDMISRHDINIDQLTEKRQFPEKTEFQQGDELVVTVGLKNIRDASYDEQQESRFDIRTIVLEVICKKTIEEWLNQNKFGLVESKRVRHSDVHSCSLVRAWARSCEDRRCWLCKRSEGGCLTVESCLNDFDTLERFEDICEDDNGGHPWVTVFAEHKRPHETFEQIDKDTIIVFCKSIDANADPSYLGCLHVKNTMQCQDLVTKIVEDLRKLPENTPHNVYVEKGDHCVDLTSCTETLDKCGIASGSVVILTEKEFDMKNHCTVRTLLPAIQPSESEVEDGDAQNPAAATNTLDGSRSIGAAPDGDQPSGNQPTAQAAEDSGPESLIKPFSAFALGPKNEAKGDIPFSVTRSGKKLPLDESHSHVSEITKASSHGQGAFTNTETLELQKDMKPVVQRLEGQRRSSTT